MNHILGKDLELIANAIGVFGCCDVERLIKNKYTIEDWKNYFNRGSQTLESLVQQIKEKMGPKSFKQYWGNRLDLMMEYNSTNPNHKLGRNDVRCRCNGCKQKDTTQQNYNMEQFFRPQEDRELSESLLKQNLKSDDARQFESDYLIDIFHWLGIPQSNNEEDPFDWSDLPQSKKRGKYQVEEIFRDWRRNFYVRERCESDVAKSEKRQRKQLQPKMMPEKIFNEWLHNFHFNNSRFSKGESLRRQSSKMNKTPIREDA